MRFMSLQPGVIYREKWAEEGNMCKRVDTVLIKEAELGKEEGENVCVCFGERG